MDCRFKKVKKDKYKITIEQMITKADEQLKQLKEKDPYPFYYPSLIRTSPDIYFSDSPANEYVSCLLLKGGIEYYISLWKKLDIQNIEVVRMTILSIKLLCDTVSKAKSISSTLSEGDKCHINQFVQQVCYLCEQEEDSFELLKNREKLLTNRNKIVDKRINVMLSHKKWPKLVEISKPEKDERDYEKNRQKKREIRMLYKEIIIDGFEKIPVGNNEKENDALKKLPDKNTITKYKKLLTSCVDDEIEKDSNSIGKKS